MYTQKTSRNEDADELLAFTRAHTFALFVTGGDTPVATHVPVLTGRAEDGTLIVEGHIARANAQPLTGTALIVWSGPHAYVSPGDYDERGTVPTWAYVAVHAAGICEEIGDPDALAALVTRLSAHHERGRPQPWAPVWGPGDVKPALLRAIRGFRVRATEVTGNWKLNQHHPPTRRRRAIAALRARGGENEIAIAALMERTLEPKG